MVVRILLSENVGHDGAIAILLSGTATPSTLTISAAPVGGSAPDCGGEGVVSTACDAPGRDEADRIRHRSHYQGAPYGSTYAWVPNRGGRRGANTSHQLASSNTVFTT